MPLSNTGFKGLWVDDERPLPEEYAEAGWTSAPTFHEAILKLELIEFDEVSLDHDLGIRSVYGNREMTGYDILNWLERRKIMEEGYTPPIVHVHTANSEGRRKMDLIVQEHFSK
jgi:hypothetical protein